MHKNKSLNQVVVVKPLDCCPVSLKLHRCLKAKTWFKLCKTIQRISLSSTGNSHLSWQYGLAFSFISLMRKSSSLPSISPFKRSSNAKRPSNREPSREARRPISMMPRPPGTASSPSETAVCCNCRKNWRKEKNQNYKILNITHWLSCNRSMQHDLLKIYFLGIPAWMEGFVCPSDHGTMLSGEICLW